MNTYSHSVFEAIADIALLPTKLFPLAAIHYLPRFRYALGWTTTARKGMLVRIACNSIVDVTDELSPTHTIIECRGTLYDSRFEIDVEDLDTQELITIKL